MKHCVLYRLGRYDKGAPGVLFVDGFPVCLILERTFGPENRVIVPPGIYRLELGRFNRGGYPTYEIMDVPGHTEVKVHIGNKETDSRGCLLTGRKWGTSWEWPLLDSKLAFGDFMAAMGGDREAVLKVIEVENA